MVLIADKRIVQYCNSPFCCKTLFSEQPYLQQQVPLQREREPKAVFRQLLPKTPYSVGFLREWPMAIFSLLIWVYLFSSFGSSSFGENNLIKQLYLLCNTFYYSTSRPSNLNLSTKRNLYKSFKTQLNLTNSSPNFVRNEAKFISLL